MNYKIRSEIEQEEEVIWSGQPDYAVYYGDLKQKTVLSAGISLIALCAILMSKINSPIFSIMMPLICTGIYVFIDKESSYVPENAEFYVVTDRKVITYDPDREVNQIVSVKLSDIKKVTIEKSIKGKSTLKLHKDYIKLYFIEDAAEVRELILSSRVSETR